MLMLVWLTDLIVGRRLGRAGYLGNRENMGGGSIAPKRLGGQSLNLPFSVWDYFILWQCYHWVNPRGVPPDLHPMYASALSASSTEKSEKFISS